MSKAEQHSCFGQTEPTVSRLRDVHVLLFSFDVLELKNLSLHLVDVDVRKRMNGKYAKHCLTVYIYFITERNQIRHWISMPGGTSISPRVWVWHTTRVQKDGGLPKIIIYLILLISSFDSLWMQIARKPRSHV